jgi:hypothetical protein
MHIESTLGGVAASADGSSWPDKAPDVLDDIDALEVHDPLPIRPEVTASDLEKVIEELKRIVSELKPILTAMACGIEEVHLTMDCLFVSAKPYMRHTTPKLKELIELTKEGAACSDDRGELHKSFGIARQIHSLIKAAHLAEMHGEESPDQEELIAQIMAVLNAA